MSNSKDSVELIPLLIGLVFIVLLGYILVISLPSEYLVYFYGFLVLLLLGIFVVIYFGFKSKTFRNKLFHFLKVFSKEISKLGLDIIKNLSEEEKKEKKKRIPLPNNQKNRVYDLAGGKCQECGKKGNLKIHHIDGDPSNNRITNLVLLCGNHHDDADKGVIPKWRLRNIRDKQATPDHTSYQS